MPSVSPSPAAPSLWLSILIPVYNVEAYLAECVESIMQQADEGVEILLLDDCVPPIAQPPSCRNWKHAGPAACIC